MPAPADTYDVRFTVSDGTSPAATTTVVIVEAEKATVSFDGNNLVGVEVVVAGGNSGSFSLITYVEETEPDLASYVAGSGDGGLAQVLMELAPVGPGSSAAGTCSQVGVTGTGYGQELEVRCDFDDVPVNTYTATVIVDGGYYTGNGEDVLTVFDPSLGFTTGGGWFYWPGTTDRTNFGYTMKYNKKGQNVQGSLLMIRHLTDGMKYRVKSNQLAGLALGDGGGFGWASFSGRSTYLEPGWPEPIGNHEFIAYVEDHGEPGTGDRFWIEVHDREGHVVPASSIAREAYDNAVTLGGGNIVVPHTAIGTGKR